MLRICPRKTQKARKVVFVINKPTDSRLFSCLSCFSWTVNKWFNYFEAIEQNLPLFILLAKLIMNPTSHNQYRGHYEQQINSQLIIS